MRRRGFTLVEVAMVLVIIGFIIMTIFPALTAVRTSSQRSLTQNNLKLLMQATAVYVQANGCLPCPMVPTTTGTGFGYVRGDSKASTTPCSTSISKCAAQGIAPYASLGVPASTAHDGWGHWITMAVDPTLTYAFNVVPPAGQNGLCNSDIVLGTTASNSQRIMVQTPNGSSTPPSQQAAVLFVSHGSTGFGSFYAQAFPSGLSGRVAFPSDYPPCSSSGGYAQCNASGTQTFVDAPPIFGGTSTYDDVMTYLDRNSLVSLLGNSSCQTVW